MNCFRCGGDNPSHVTFCRHCGQRLIGAPLPDTAPPQTPAVTDEGTVACLRCGARNSRSLKYCETCGTALEKDAGAPPPLNVGADVQAAPLTVPRAVPTVDIPIEVARAQPAPSPPPPAVAPVPNPEPPAIAPAPVPAQGGSSSPTCWRCGGTVVARAAFCQTCGAQLNRSPQAAPDVAPPRARLIVIAQDGTPGREHHFDGGQLDIGRAEGDLKLDDDAYVCPRHARILWKNGQFWVTDLGSVNGIYARLTAAEPLQHGDLVLIGLQVLRFELVTADEQAQVQAIERGTRLFGSPAAPRFARLVQRTVEGVSRNIFYISRSRTTIGRESGDLVFTDDPFMSRQHAEISRQPEGGFLLTDLGSSNGTFLTIRNQRPLNDGDHVRIGQHLFRLKISP